jgi:hypothetical protein
MIFWKKNDLPEKAGAQANAHGCRGELQPRGISEPLVISNGARLLALRW